MRRIRTAVFLVQGLLLTAVPLCAQEVSGSGKNFSAYFIGNSLTFGLSPDKLRDNMFKAAGGSLEYGSSMGANISLHEHWAHLHDYTGKDFKRNVYESKPFSNDWRYAFANFSFDAIVLQSHLSWLETDPAEYASNANKIGDHQAISNFIAYATGSNPSNHVSCGRFFIYCTWPQLVGLHYRNPRTQGSLSGYPVSHSGSYTGYTLADFYNAPYLAANKGSHVFPNQPRQSMPSRDFFTNLVCRLNADFPDLPAPVRLIPAGDVLAVIDTDIRNGKVPGIKRYFERNARYYAAARKDDAYFPIPSNTAFDAAFGAVNFYCDDIHMNDQPHYGKSDGTIGAYVAALTIYATLSGRCPVGLGVEKFVRFDPVEDAELITYLQKTVWDVVTGDPFTGVTKAGNAFGGDHNP
jgi:hypothetical protein